MVSLTLIIEKVSVLLEGSEEAAQHSQVMRIPALPLLPLTHV